MQLKFSQIKFLLPSLCLSCSLRCHLKASICRQPSHKLVAKPFDCKTKLIAPYSPTGYLFFVARKTTSAQPGLFSLVTQFLSKAAIHTILRPVDSFRLSPKLDSEFSF